MQDYLKILLDKMKGLLGPVWSFVPMIAGAITQSLKSGDVDKVKAHAQELREAAAALVDLADELDAVVADGKVSISELGAALEAVQHVVDEAEDVGTGHD